MLYPILSKGSLCVAVFVGVLCLGSQRARGHVALDAPNGGEVVEVGSVVTIEWHILISHNLLNWDLWYSTTGAGGPWISIAQNLPAGSGAVGSIHTYDWTVPDDPSSQVRIRVRMDNSATDYEDMSNGDLTIEAGPVVPTVSQWGMIVMTLLVLAAGSLLLARARGHRATSA